MFFSVGWIILAGQRKTDFVDVLYEKYSEAASLKDALARDPNTVDLRD